MKAKSVIAFVFLSMLWVSVAGIEYDVAMHLGFLLSFLVMVFALTVVLGELLRAPEGYEDQDGFRIGAPA